jgi:hypothetical protein
MAVDLNNLLANAMLDRYDTEFPAGSLVQIRTGAPPGAEAAAGGTLLAEIVSPATPWNAAASGSKTKNGTWSVAAVAAGVAGHYRMKNAADTRREEGTVGQGSGDLSLDNTNIAVGQTVTINTFTKNL